MTAPNPWEALADVFVARREQGKRLGTRKEHGVPGQLNAYVLDVDSDCTGRGKHWRCIVAGDLDGAAVEVHARWKLHLAHLPIPTEEQARRVAMGLQRVHDSGRLAFDSLSCWQSNGDDVWTFRFKVTQ